MRTTALDRVIAGSKQVTEDLMVVRREVKRGTTARNLDDARQRAADRLRIALDSWTMVYEELHDLWLEAAGLKKNKPERRAEMAAMLENGQLKLIAGDRS